MGTSRRVRSPAHAPGGHDSAGPRPAAVFRREGDYWTIVYAGRTVRVRDALGLRYLVCLLSHPYERFPAVDLIAAVRGNGAVDPERARSAVSKRIRDAIERIARHDRALGYHFSTTIKTGYACAYLPDPDQPIVWTT